MKEEYRRYMVQVKAWQIYINIYKEHSYQWDRIVNIFIAIMSSTSIAAWTVWQKFSYVWAILIALSQVIVAIKTWLPFGERLKVLVLLEGDLTLLFNKIEYNWYAVNLGEIQNEDIIKMLYEYKDNLINMEKNYLKDIIIPERTDYRKLADQRTEEYFNDFQIKRESAVTLEKISMAFKLPLTEACPKWNK